MLCARCLNELVPGSGDFYVVKIEAVCDPTPPEFPEHLDAEEIRRQMQETLRQLHGISPREAMDEVCRTLTIHLCRGCYREWIEDPAGRK